MREREREGRLFRLVVEGEGVTPTRGTGVAQAQPEKESEPKILSLSIYT